MAKQKYRLDSHRNGTNNCLIKFIVRVLRVSYLSIMLYEITVIGLALGL